MKKLFLFIGVIILCLLFSCKKDSSQPSTIPIPFTKGTWWKYQRIQKLETYNNPCSGCNNTSSSDSSIELITVIGKSPFFDSITVEAFVLEVKNLTKGTLDTIHAYYRNDFFYMWPIKDEFGLMIYMPLFEGYSSTIPNQSSHDVAYVINNISINVFNQNFDNCINYFNSNSSFYGAYSSSMKINTYLKSGIGFVYWEKSNSYTWHYGNGNSGSYYRRLIDYHIEP